MNILVFKILEINVIPALDQAEGLLPSALGALKRPAPQTNVLTPFRGILQTVHYAHKHAYLINELAENYTFMDD